jgi:hypothetical protein
MPKNELQNLMAGFSNSVRTPASEIKHPVRKLTNTSPPPAQMIISHSTVASIPHKNKMAPYLD